LPRNTLPSKKSTIIVTFDHRNSYLEKSIFCQKMLDIIIINNNVDVDLLREFRLVKELLIENFFFAIDFSIKDSTNLLIS